MNEISCIKWASMWCQSGYRTVFVFWPNSLFQLEAENANSADRDDTVYGISMFAKYHMRKMWKPRLRQYHSCLYDSIKDVVIFGFSRSFFFFLSHFHFCISSIAFKLELIVIIIAVDDIVVKCLEVRRVKSIEFKHDTCAATSVQAVY